MRWDWSIGEWANGLRKVVEWWLFEVRLWFVDLG